MPYSISQGGGTCGASQYAVLSDSGKTMGCHDTKDEAQDQLAALYVNDPDAKESSHEIPAPQLPRGRMMAMRHATTQPDGAQRHASTPPTPTSRQHRSPRLG